MWADLRVAVRVMRRHWALYSALTLVLGAGLTSTLLLFCLEDALIIRPLRVPDAAALVHVGFTSRHDGVRLTVTAQDAVDLKRNIAAFDALAGLWQRGCVLHLPLGDLGVRCAEVTADFWRIVGLPAVEGFGADRLTADGATPTVVGHRFWLRHLHAQTAAVGTTLWMRDVDPVTTLPTKRALRIVGVAPPDFHLPGDSELWLLAGEGATANTVANFELWARLRPGASLEQASLQTQRAVRQVVDWPEEELKVIVRPLSDALVPEGGQAITILLVTALGVLVIGWASAATLIGARVLASGHEHVVRLALGASRWQMLRGYVAQAVLLAGAAVVVGLTLTYWSLPAIIRHVALARGRHVPVTAFAVLFALGASVVCAGTFVLLISRLLPKRLDASVWTASGTRTYSSGGRPLQWLLGGALTLTAAFAYVSLVLFLGFARLYWKNPGFDPKNLMNVSVILPLTEQFSSAETRTLYDQLIENVGALPGVVDVTLVSHNGPLSGWRSSVALSPAGEPDRIVTGQEYAIRPGFFRTIGARIVRGRDFDRQMDMIDGASVVINGVLARALWGSLDPVGKAVLIRDVHHTVVGVSSDFQEKDLRLPPGPQVFVYGTGHTFLIRTSTPQAIAPMALRGAVGPVHPGARVLYARSYEDMYWSMTTAERSQAIFMGVLAGAALVTGLLALWGHVSHWVSASRRTSAVVQALGATELNVISAVVTPVGWIVATALGLGLCLGIAACRLLGTALVGSIFWEPSAALFTAAVLASGALVATTGPLRSLLRVPPAEALKVN